MVGMAVPTRWLLKNTDTFAGFAHAINSYLAGVALASRHGVGLIHRPQAMAHGLGLTFSDFFENDPRGVVPPVYAPALHVNNTAMSINGYPVHLYVQLATTGNSTAIANQLNSLPHNSVLWLRKGRAAFTDGCEPTNGCYYPPEVRYAGLWLRERFWRAALARLQAMQLRFSSGPPPGGSGGGPMRMRGSGGGLGGRLNGQRPRPLHSSTVHQTHSSADGGPIRICVHVRRGDVYYLGPKTHKPHPHWVETTTVLDILAGVRRALELPLELPGVIVDVFSERGWLKNDTAALQAIAPGAAIHLDSSPSSTVDALIQMSRADLLLMGSSGFSFWAGVFGCGVKIGERPVEALPFRHVGYGTTLTTRIGSFWPSAGKALRREWSRYWACRRDPICRPTLCQAKWLWQGDGQAPRPVWSESALALEQLADARAVQWRLPDLVLWPATRSGSNGTDGFPFTSNSSDTGNRGVLQEMSQTCATMEVKLERARGVKRKGKAHSVTSSAGHGLGLTPCVRNMWLHNLTAFLAGRRTVPGACC